MLIIFSSGRLGNQLFQLTAGMSISRIYEKIILVGFDDLSNLVPLNKFISFRLNILFKFFKAYIKFFDKLNAPFLFINRVKEDASGVAFIEKAIFDINLNVIFDCYFQNEVNLEERAISVINSLIKPKPNHENKFFVHVRRGDYLNWPSSNNPAFLDDSWYIRQVEYIKAKNPQASFIFLGDDFGYISSLSKQVTGATIFHGDAFSDFNFMLNCSGGILSASSYSWWVAKIIAFNNPTAILVAPKFWIGHRVGRWIPNGIKSNFLIYKN